MLGEINSGGIPRSSQVNNVRLTTDDFYRLFSIQTVTILENVTWSGVCLSAGLVRPWQAPFLWSYTEGLGTAILVSGANVLGPMH